MVKLIRFRGARCTLIPILALLPLFLCEACTPAPDSSTLDVQVPVDSNPPAPAPDTDALPSNVVIMNPLIPNDEGSNLADALQKGELAGDVCSSEINAQVTKKFFETGGSAQLRALIGLCVKVDWEEFVSKNPAFAGIHFLPMPPSLDKTNFDPLGLD